jgi:hypothetical protein
MTEDSSAIWAREEEMEKRARISHGRPDPPPKPPDWTLWTPSEAREVTRSSGAKGHGRADTVWDREQGIAPTLRTVGAPQTSSHGTEGPAAPASPAADLRPRTMVRREKEARARRRRLLLLLVAVIFCVTLVVVSEILAERGVIDWFN